MTAVHQAVLVREVVEALELRPGASAVDATVGLGGHARAILERTGPDGRLVGIDRDAQALEIARQSLAEFGERVVLLRGHFGKLEELLEEAGADRVQGALFDLGVSSLQLDEPERGFSFSREGPLDMRMDPDQPLTAAEIVNHASETDLREMIREYGQERWAGRIARAIVRRRPLGATSQLADLIRGAVPPAGRHGRIHAATRTFQAIRIAVNRELELLPLGLRQAIRRLQPGGKIVVLSYHSLEDRIVKVVFREEAKEGVVEIVTPKPLQPGEEELARNPRSRSARMRVARKR